MVGSESYREHVNWSQFPQCQFFQHIV
jgi:hypothetical protein